MDGYRKCSVISHCRVTTKREAECVVLLMVLRLLSMLGALVLVGTGTMRRAYAIMEGELLNDGCSTSIG